MRFLMLVALLSGITSLPVKAGTPPIDLKSLQDLAIPYYPKGQSSPAAVVRVKRVYGDYQRRGFFRIGLLPLLVGDEVTVEVLKPEALAEGLNAARLWLKPKAVERALEWRRVRFVFPGSTQARLEADRVQLADHGAWRLSGNVMVRAGKDELAGSEALLEVAGSRAGLLSLKGEAKTLNLLEFSSDKGIGR